MYIVLILIVFGLLTGVVASSKGRSFIGWFVYGFFLGIFALIHASLIGNRGLKCPKCYSYIDKRATVCPFCKHKRTPEEIKRANKARQKGLDTKLIVAIVIISMLILIGILSNIFTANQQKSLDSIDQQVIEINKNSFNVPSLVDNNFDYALVVLGSPEYKMSTTAQIQAGTKEAVFRKDGKELDVTYNISNNSFVEFFIPTDDPSGKTKDKTHLLALAKANVNDPKYTVQFVADPTDASSYIGIKITPN